jgi:hypothetical protein
MFFVSLCASAIVPAALYLFLIQIPMTMMIMMMVSLAKNKCMVTHTHWKYVLLPLLKLNINPRSCFPLLSDSSSLFPFPFPSFLPSFFFLPRQRLTENTHSSLPLLLPHVPRLLCGYCVLLFYLPVAALPFSVLVSSPSSSSSVSLRNCLASAAALWPSISVSAFACCLRLTTHRASQFLQHRKTRSKRSSRI